MSRYQRCDVIEEEKCWAAYQKLIQLALANKGIVGEQEFLSLLMQTHDPSLQARIRNEIGVLAVTAGRIYDAYQAFEEASRLLPDWLVPRQNLSCLLAEASDASFRCPLPASRQTRVAIVSLLFNWPSTGGGTVHTAETGRSLMRAGFQVQHFYAEFSEWGLGNVDQTELAPCSALRFTSNEWTVSEIQCRFRAAIKAFEPDWVIVTDSWNSKPILAESVREYRYFLRIAAQECLCPLNNVRLLFEQGRHLSCPKHQLATPAACCQCVAQNGRFSGDLHRAERELVRYGSREYDQTLRRALADAEAVLVVNPLIAAMVSPYAKRVCVVPSGFDSARFPPVQVQRLRSSGDRLRILFAGLVNEPMKGFDVLYDACSLLWSERQDFELLATADPPQQLSDFARFVGWQSQKSLPLVMQDVDIVAFPTIAEEALGRTAVEAMGAGRPVVASRIGGLQFTVLEGATGLLFEPGSVSDLCRKLKRLLDDEALREKMGKAGRLRFEEHYTWEAVVAHHYKPLLRMEA